MVNICSEATRFYKAIKHFPIMQTDLVGGIRPTGLEFDSKLTVRAMFSCSV